MKSLRERVLNMFRKMKRERLDLHVLFEAAGNDPVERKEVLDAIEELVRDGLLLRTAATSLVDLRVVPRARNTADIYDALDAVRAQKPEELFPCAGRMPNRQDSGHFGLDLSTWLTSENHHPRPGVLS
jgi:hypothetical protein